MNAILVYMLKSALYLTAFYIIYSLLLSRDTTYARNRVFILLSLASAMILPDFTLQNVKPFDMQFFGKYLSDVLITASSAGNGKVKYSFSSLSAFNLVSLIYLIGASIFTLKLIGDLINLWFLILRQKNRNNRIIRFHGFSTAGFSAMGYVFINTKLSPDEASEIIKHEQNHLKRNHFIDIIFVEIIKAFQWFNPAVYLFNRSLRAIHEYQADQECLVSGIPVVSYQSLLLNQVFKTNTFTLTNSFSNPSLIRKRMMMMTKKRTSALASAKLLLVIPVIGFVFFVVSAFVKITNPQSETAYPEVTDLKAVSTEMEPYVSVEEMPMFKGGDGELLKYLAENTIYPENAKNNNIQGRIIVRFSVSATGTVNRASILKGVDPDLDAEAIRVVNTLPAFIPGKQGGKAVPVWYMVPITFTLK
jgi:TonB family protein